MKRLVNDYSFPLLRGIYVLIFLDGSLGLIESILSGTMIVERYQKPALSDNSCIMVKNPKPIPRRHSAPQIPKQVSEPRSNEI